MRALGPLSIDTYLPALPAIATDLHTSTSATQLTLTATLAGLGIGQLVFGPLSDSYGRRRPLLAGSVLFVVAAVVCATAPTVTVLVIARFALGFAGAAGLVTSMAIARDISDPTTMAKLLAALMLVTGVVPLLAPVLGGQLLTLTTWRGIFFTLAGLGAIIAATSWRRAPETLPPAARRPGGLMPTLRTFRMLLGDRAFSLPLVTLMLGSAGLFGYLSGSPFLLQDVHHLSPQAFSVIFGINTLGVTALSQLNGRLVHRTGAAALLMAGTSITAAGGLLLLVATVVGGSLTLVLPALFLVVAGMGLVFPNTTTLALADHGATAGSASALLGLGQFVAGAAAAPLVGLGRDPSLSMAVVVAVVMCGAALTAAASVRVSRSARAASPRASSAAR